MKTEKASLVPVHGAEVLNHLLPAEADRQKYIESATGLKRIDITSREASDLFMMGIGAFTPLTGFMNKADWLGVCENFTMADGTFWPIPITCSVDEADQVSVGDEIALHNEEYGGLIASMKVEEKYEINKTFECEKVFGTADENHPGAAKVMAQLKYNIAGPVTVLSEGGFPEEYGDLYATPSETRALFKELGWSRVAAFQTRNPMHRSHEYLVKIALEIMDGVIIHQILGKLKSGDIPADVRIKAIQALTDNYFVAGSITSKGYPMEMRYAGPREALLHAVFRQNFGCSHLIVGRDHAGVGDYYGPFDAQDIFDHIPAGALAIQTLNIDWTFHCYKCGGMASMKTCPHGKEDRLQLSGTMIRKVLSEGGELPGEFSRPEVLEVLQKYYQGLEENVEIKLHGHATGSASV